MTAFPRVVLQAFDEVGIVDVETRSKDGATHQVKIWIVVVDGVPYVRSVRGPKGRWFRELMARKEGAIHVGKRRIPVRPVRVTAVATNEKVSDAIRAKYPGPKQSVAAMVRDEVLGTTARLEPF